MPLREGSLLDMMPHDMTFSVSMTQRTRPELVCGQCRECMVPAFSDSLFLEASDPSADQAWRCVNCGEWVDTTVVMNRKRAGGCDGTLPSSFVPLSSRRWR